MKITEIRTTVVGAPWRELTFVELLTDEGLTGLGEVRMVNKTDTLLAAVGELGRRHVVGLDPFDTTLLARRVGWEEFGRVGEVTASALAAFDVACHDLQGQALGVPVWKLLGGRVRDSVRAYANGWYRGERTPETFAALAREVVDRGYTALKVDPFGAASTQLNTAERTRSVDMLAAVRDAVGPGVQLMVEMHGRFTAGEAARIAALVEPLDPEWLEEPTPPGNASSLRAVRSRTRLPLAAGERTHTPAELREIVEDQLVDVIQTDLTHAGGFTGLRAIASWAATYDMVVAPHNVCGPVGTMANVHFAVATQNHMVLEHFNDFADPWVFDLVDGAPTVGPDGTFAVPQAPGLGVRLRPEVCAEHPRTGAFFDLNRTGWELREH